MQVSQVLRALPVAALCVTASLAAQTGYRVKTDGTWFHQSPEGKRLARLVAGVVLPGATVQNDWVQVTLDGWIFATSIGPSTREGFDVAVTHAGEENMRATPRGAVIAHVPQGFGLAKTGEDGKWVHVRRDGWVRLTAVEPTAVAASSRSGTVAPVDSSSTLPPAPLRTRSAADSGGAADASHAAASRRTTLYREPEGLATGAIASQTPLRVLGRSGEWTRVQFEGWVRTADLAAAPPGVLVGVSAAELRADPQRYAGQVVQWTLQYIALQTADDLRPDIPDGTTYVLARGPLPERGFVYVVLPDGNAGPVAALAPLTTIHITARVRVGRSRFIGNPVVDLISLEAQP